MFIATGQDAACTAEAAVGITRMEITSNGDLYAALTLPNLIVGTVGGGTSLSTRSRSGPALPSLTGIRETRLLTSCWVMQHHPLLARTASGAT